MVFRFSLLSYLTWSFDFLSYRTVSFAIDIVNVLIWWKESTRKARLLLLDLIFVRETAVVLYVRCVVVLHPSPPTVSKLYKSSGVQSIQTMKTQNMGQHRYFTSPLFFLLPPPFLLPFFFSFFFKGCGGLGGVSRTSLFLFSLTHYLSTGMKFPVLSILW